MSEDTFKAQNRGGKGIKGMQTIDADYVEELFMTNTHHYIMFFTNAGRVYRLKGYEIPEPEGQPEEQRSSIFFRLCRRKKLQQLFRLMNTGMRNICLWQPEKDL